MNNWSTNLLIGRQANNPLILSFKLPESMKSQKFLSLIVNMFRPGQLECLGSSQSWISPGLNHLYSHARQINAKSRTFIRSLFLPLTLLKQFSFTQFVQSTLRHINILSSLRKIFSLHHKENNFISHKYICSRDSRQSHSGLTPA